MNYLLFLFLLHSSCAVWASIESDLPLGDFSLVQQDNIEGQPPQASDRQYISSKLLLKAARLMSFASGVISNVAGILQLLDSQREPDPEQHNGYISGTIGSSLIMPLFLGGLGMWCMHKGKQEAIRLQNVLYEPDARRYVLCYFSLQNMGKCLVSLSLSGTTHIISFLLPTHARAINLCGGFVGVGVPVYLWLKDIRHHIVEYCLPIERQ